MDIASSLIARKGMVKRELMVKSDGNKDTNWHQRQRHSSPTYVGFRIRTSVLYTIISHQINTKGKGIWVQPMCGFRIQNSALHTIISHQVSYLWG